MRRRALLAAAAAATTGIAGCIDDGPGDGSGDDPTPTSTPSPTETADGPRLVDESLEVTRVECGNDYGGHDVTTSEGVVTVEGVLDGSNGCYTAELVASEYDAGDDELYVAVEAVEDRDDEEACTTCIVEIEYVAEFTFEGGEPSSVRVEQRGATSGSSSDSESGGDGGSGNDSGGSTSESRSGSGEDTPEPTATGTDA